MKKGAVIKTTNISEDFTFQDYLNKYDRELIPLISISGKKVGVFKSDKKTEPKAGWKIVSLILNPAKVASEKKLEAAKAAGSIKDGALPSDPEPEK